MASHNARRNIHSPEFGRWETRKSPTLSLYNNKHNNFVEEAFWENKDDEDDVIEYAEKK